MQILISNCILCSRSPPQLAHTNIATHTIFFLQSSAFAIECRMVLQSQLNILYGYTSIHSTAYYIVLRLCALCVYIFYVSTTKRRPYIVESMVIA